MLRRAALLTVAACLLVLAARADEKPGTRLKGWGEVIDPDRDCHISLDRDKVTVKVPGKAHDFAAELQRWNAPRILSEVGGDFIAEVKVSGQFKPSATSTIEGRRSYNDNRRWLCDAPGPGKVSAGPACRQAAPVATGIARRSSGGPSRALTRLANDEATERSRHTHLHGRDHPQRPR